MNSTVTITLERQELDALLDRAGRESPRTSLERHVVDDVREQVSTQDITVASDATRNDGYEQLTLFDPEPYAV